VTTAGRVDGKRADLSKGTAAQPTTRCSVPVLVPVPVPVLVPPDSGGPAVSATTKSGTVSNRVTVGLDSSSRLSSL